MKKKDPEYRNLIKESWNLLIKNPVLLMPGMLMLFISVALVILYLSISGIMETMIKSPEVIINKSALQQKIGFLLLDIALVTLFDVFFITMKYGMVKEVILKKKTSFVHGLKFGLNNYFKVISVYIMSVVIIFFPLIFIGAVTYAALISTGLFKTLAGLIITLLIIIIGIVYAAYMLFNFLFVYPVLVFEEKGVIGSIKKEFHYVKTNITHTLVSWLIVIGILLLYLILRTPVGFLGKTTTNIFIAISIPFVIFLIENVFSMWEHLFIFKSYIEGRR